VTIPAVQSQPNLFPSQILSPKSETRRWEEIWLGPTLRAFSHFVQIVREDRAKTPIVHRASSKTPIVQTPIVQRASSWYFEKARIGTIFMDPRIFKRSM